MFAAENIRLVGDVFLALATHLGLQEQACVSDFPEQIARAQDVLRSAAEGSMTASKMLADVADCTAGIKSLVCPSSCLEIFLWFFSRNVFCKLCGAILRTQSMCECSDPTLMASCFAAVGPGRGLEAAAQRVRYEETLQSLARC